MSLLPYKITLFIKEVSIRSPRKYCQFDNLRKREDRFIPKTFLDGPIVIFLKKYILITG